MDIIKSCTVILVSMGALCLVLIVIAIIGVYAIIVNAKHEHDHGLNYVGAQHKYFKAMRVGDGQSAVYWAEKTTKYAAKEKRSFQEEWLGYAFELNGQNEEALQIYQERNNQPTQMELDIPRVKFKLGQTEEAFQGYCRYADINHALSHERLNDQRLEQRIWALGRIRYPITMERDGFYMRLSPFLEYKDFLNFMEKEYQKLGEPSEYAAAMELFQAIDTEINEERLPKPHAELKAMRAKILAERAASKVTE